MGRTAYLKTSSMLSKISIKCFIIASALFVAIQGCKAPSRICPGGCGKQLKKRTIVWHTNGHVYRVISCSKNDRKPGEVLAVPETSPQSLKVSKLKCYKCIRRLAFIGCAVCEMPLKTGTVVYHKHHSKQIQGGGTWKIVKRGNKEDKEGRVYAVSTGTDNALPHEPSFGVDPSGQTIRSFSASDLFHVSHQRAFGRSYGLSC